LSRKTKLDYYHVIFLLALQGEIALAQAILPIVTHFSVVWSVSLSLQSCYIRAQCLNRWMDLNAKFYQSWPIYYMVWLFKCKKYNYEIHLHSLYFSSFWKK